MVIRSTNPSRFWSCRLRSRTRLRQRRRLFFHVGISKVVKEQQEKREIEQEREVDVLGSDAAIGCASGVDLKSGDEVDKDANDHLEELKRGYGDANRFGDVETERAEHVVGVHDRVDGEVHGNEPAAVGD